MKLLLAVEVVVILAVIGLWLFLRDDPAANAVNDGLRGSRPPAGQVWPDLASVEGIEPRFPTRAAIDGAPTVLVATCTSCRSGDIIGGFLGRLAPDALPDDARVVVLTWGGDQRAWVDEWGVDRERYELHVVAPGDDASLAVVRRAVGIAPVDGGEESGITFVHDRDAVWRSSFYIGQLVAEDLAHDVEALARD